MMKSNLVMGIISLGLLISTVYLFIANNKKACKIEKQQELIHAYEGYYDHTEAMLDSIASNNEIKTWPTYYETMRKYESSADSVSMFYL